jgi:acetolactate synthase-1/2/3 large subunit
MSREMTGAEMVVQALIDQGVNTLFGYPGGAVLPIYDALFQQDSVKHILVRHEQGAVHAAEGYARSSGKVGVVLVTSGPGATNAVTGLTDALMDSIPLVCFTGQVPTHLIGSDAFQEADTVGITRHCTKHNYLVKNIEDLPRILHEAFYVAQNGRPGPVVIDIPKDIQFKSGKYEKPRDNQHKTYRPQIKGDLSKIKAAVELIAKAKRPVFYTGGGVINAGPHAAQLLRELVRATGYPITSTLMGLGAYPAHDPQWLGMLGMHGTYEANLAMHGCDLMVHRRAVRRPHHRAARRLLADVEEDPHRHRPLLDQQERPGRHPDRRRLRLRAGGHGEGVEGRAQPAQVDKPRSRPGGSRSRAGGRKKSLSYTQVERASSCRNTRSSAWRR